MKFMLNGAVTVGTLDGANVEMREQVGDENIYIFGLTADEVTARLHVGDKQEVKNIYASNHALRRVLDQLISGELDSARPQLFRDLYQTLLFGDYGYPDTYMVLRDFESYCAIHDRIAKDYQDRDKWLEKTILNTASSGYFSSDRTISEYNEKIWHLKPLREK